MEGLKYLGVVWRADLGIGGRGEGKVAGRS